MLRLMVADVDSPSYFVAAAAADLGFFRSEGIDVVFESAHGAQSGLDRLRNGSLDFFAGPAFAVTRALTRGKSAKILCALSQYSYWFLAVRADLNVRRGDVNALKGLRISSSRPRPEMGLRYLLTESGIDPVRDHVAIVPSVSPDKSERWKGHAGVEALTQGVADAYWGNGMRVAVGERLGIAKLHLDLRRGDGPPGALHHNFAALMTTDRLIDDRPEVAAAVVRAIVKTQRALKDDPSLAVLTGNRLFPPDEAALIVDLIARDAPFYSAVVSDDAVSGLNRLAKASGLATDTIAYDRLVAAQFRHIWCI